MSMNSEQVKNIVEAALMSAGQPLSLDRLLSLFMDEQQPSRDELREALDTLREECANRGVELVEVGSGFRFQAKQDFAPWVARLWEEKPPRYSRALLETLALIAYRQPITRGEIEDVRGVTVSSNIIKTLLERDWVKVVGHRDVPGKPAMYATTRQFLDYFNLKSLSEMPSLAEIRDIDTINAELDLAEPGAEQVAAGEAESGEDASQAAAETVPAETASGDNAETDAMPDQDHGEEYEQAGRDENNPLMAEGEEVVAIGESQYAEVHPQGATDEDAARESVAEETQPGSVAVTDPA